MTELALQFVIVEDDPGNALCRVREVLLCREGAPGVTRITVILWRVRNPDIDNLTGEPASELLDMARKDAILRVMDSDSGDEMRRAISMADSAFLHGLIHGVVNDFEGYTAVLWDNRLTEASRSFRDSDGQGSSEAVADELGRRLGYKTAVVVLMSSATNYAFDPEFQTRYVVRSRSANAVRKAIDVVRGASGLRWDMPPSTGGAASGIRFVPLTVSGAPQACSSLHEHEVLTLLRAPPRDHLVVDLDSSTAGYFDSKKDAWVYVPLTERRLAILCELVSGALTTADACQELAQKITRKGHYQKALADDVRTLNDAVLADAGLWLQGTVTKGFSLRPGARAVMVTASERQHMIRVMATLGSARK